MAKKAISVSTLKEKKFKLVEFTGEWQKNFGNPEQNFTAIFYGPSGSGKSTYVLKLCNYLAKNHGKVLYNSFEEGISSSLRDRVVNHGIDAKKLFFYDRLTFDEFCERMKKGRYRVGVIDSTQYMNFTDTQFKILRKALPSKAFIFISQVNGKGGTKGGTDLLHACDIKVEVNNGRADIISRFGTGRKQVELFRVKGLTQLTLL